MYKIYFYKDRRGKEPVLDYIKELEKNNSKDSRIKYNKITEYIEYLRVYGLSLGEPYIKHLNGSIWELRPLRDRILFVSFDKNCFYLLHYFTKKTQITPVNEIKKAEKEFQIIKRSLNNDI